MPIRKQWACCRGHKLTTTCAASSGAAGLKLLLVALVIASDIACTGADRGQYDDVKDKQAALPKKVHKSQEFVDMSPISETVSQEKQATVASPMKETAEIHKHRGLIHHERRIRTTMDAFKVKDALPGDPGSELGAAGAALGTPMTAAYNPQAVAGQTIHPHAATMTAGGAMLRTKPLQAMSAPQPNNNTLQPNNSNSSQQLEVYPSEMVDMNDSQLIASVNDSSVSRWQTLMAIGGGTGATIGGTGVLELDQDLVRRMRYQDKAVMFLLLLMYFVTLGFSASFAYRQALNNSPVTFYADPRFHDIVTEGRDPDVFLDNFSSCPKDVHLQVTGFVPVSSGVLGSIEWQGEYYYDAFSFALDLSPWVVRESTSDASEPSATWHDDLPLVDGVVAEDLGSVQHYVARDRNDLAILEIQKEVAWPNWEELATNIKLKIRQQGFGGLISIHRTDCDSVNVYKNTAWANFMHSRTTKVLCALSVLGWIAYLPYMWLRCTSTTIRTRYTIDIPISGYWNLIKDKLTEDGFVEDPDALRTNPNRFAVPGSPAQTQFTTGQITVYAGAETAPPGGPGSEGVSDNGSAGFESDGFAPFS